VNLARRVLRTIRLPDNTTCIPGDSQWYAFHITVDPWRWRRRRRCPCSVCVLGLLAVGIRISWGITRLKSFLVGGESVSPRSCYAGHIRVQCFLRACFSLVHPSGVSRPRRGGATILARVVWSWSLASPLVGSGGFGGVVMSGHPVGGCGGMVVWSECRGRLRYPLQFGWPRRSQQCVVDEAFGHVRRTACAIGIARRTLLYHTTMPFGRFGNIFHNFRVRLRSFSPAEFMCEYY